MSEAPRIIAYQRGPFRVEEQPITGRPEPYIFARRKGGVMVLPVIKDERGQSHILTIDNQRRYYGPSKLGLPGGNIEGDFDNPDSPPATAPA